LNDDGEQVERVWEKFLTAQDKAAFAASGYGVRIGFGKRPALLIVDVSYGFTGDRPEPLLESIKRWHNSCGSVSWKAVPVIKALAEAFRGKGLPVIYTTAQFRDDGWDSGSLLWKNARTADGASGARQIPDPNEIVREIAPQPQDIVVLKQKPSAFFGTNLLGYLVPLGCDSVIVVGTTTSGCVRATVVDAYSHNFRVTVVEDGCFDRSEASHAINLCDMNAKYADVVPSAAVFAYVDTLAKNLFPNLPQAGLSYSGSRAAQ
jgi:maleamate amidohydrolase